MSKIVAFLERYGLVDDLDFNGGYIKICCPFHEEKTPSCSLNLNKDTFFCFGCEAQGTLQEAIKLLEGCSSFEALKILASLEDLEFNKRENKSKKEADRDAVKAEFLAYEFAKGLDKPSGDRLEYLEDRGFSLEIIEKFHILEKPGDIWPIVIPLYQFGKFKGICKRRIDNEFPKYYYNEGFKAKSCLAIEVTNPRLPIFLCEGIIDAISAKQMKYPNIACQFGWSTSEEQLQILSKYDIICALDCDESGERGYKSLREKFNGDVYRFDLCGFNDVNEMLVKNERKFQYSVHELIRRYKIG